MKTTLRTLGCMAAAAALAPALASVPEVKYESNLSDFSGAMPLVAVRVHVDPTTNETVVLDDATVRIFNRSGMQTYAFTIDPALGRPIDVAVEPSGDILVGAMKEAGGAFVLLRFDYRGTAKGTVDILLPESLAGFAPNAIELRDGNLLHMLSMPAYRVVVIRTDGGFVRALDLAEILRVSAEERARVSVGGFGFDGAGNLLVTLTERFLAYVIAKDGTVRDFGVAGSAAGRFGVIGSIAGDAAGNLYIADRQRSVVLVFDKDLSFLTEFGGYGDTPESLMRPQTLAVANDGRVLVGQIGRRGVSTFRVTVPTDPSPTGQEVGGNP